MMDSLDPLLVFADVQELTGEFPWIAGDVIRDLYFRLLRTTGTMPDRPEARRYLERFAEQFTSNQLRRMLDSEARDRAKRSDPDDADLPVPATGSSLSSPPMAELGSVGPELAPEAVVPAFRRRE